MSLYLYALADAPGGAATGLLGEPVRWVACAGLHAAVGEVEAIPRVAPELAKGHDDAVRALASAVRSLLPARFGSVVRDPAALEEALAPRAEALRGALSLVAGCEQMTLRLLDPNRVDDVEPPRPADASGSKYLAWRAELLKSRHVAPELDAVRPVLAPLVRAERIERHPKGALLASVFHLIARGRSDAYRAALESAPKGHVQLAVSGPWPAYAFAPEVLP